MGAVLELITRLMPAAALLLAGCATSIGDVKDALLNPPEAPEMVVPRVNRAAIEQADLAAVLVLSPTTGIASVAVAVQKRDAGIVYNSNDNRGITLDRGLVYNTLGLGTNLQAVVTQPGDPLVTGARPADWPSTVQRSYRLSGRGPTFDVINATCAVRVGDTAEIEVVGVTRRAVQIAEVCETEDGTAFNNIHYVNARTGQVWRTSQWTGPDQQNVQVDVIEPFDFN